MFEKQTMSKNKVTKTAKNNKKAIAREKVSDRSGFWHDLLSLEGDTVKNIFLLFFVLLIALFIYFFQKSARVISYEVDNMETVKITPRYNIELANKIEKITAGYPIEKMSRYLSYQDEDVAAFMVAIAKKESNWGKRTPKLNGKECYNYWGFRQKRDKMGSGGHTCFDNPRDAVMTVSDRVKKLLAKGVNTPQKMIIWKCGYTCAGHSPQSVQKWISDVSYYLDKF